MRRILQIETHHRLADFACGTGGFLIAREPDEPQASEVVGIDNSPEWAHLAWANTSLHHDAQTTILVGDPLRICGAQGLLAGKQFDRVLMNPPFGAPVDADLARATIGHETGGDSETALTALAMHVLAEEGRAAVLVPTGLLFGKNTGERGLRERLVGTGDAQGMIVGDYQLKAVISLPKDALQPYGSLQTHLLLAKKRGAGQSMQERQPTWFFQAGSDGYPPGRRRDITMPPPETANDLTYVETVLLAQDNYSGEDRIFSIENRPFIGVRRILVNSAALMTHF
jgi:type I restriction enzyme M protein